MDELSKTLCSSSYAKDNGVLLYNNDVYIREDTPALALLEVRRVAGAPFGVEFLEPREDSPIALQAPEQPLDFIATPVHGTVVFPGVKACPRWRHDRNEPQVQGQLTRLVAFVRTVHEQVNRPTRWPQTLQETTPLRGIMSLSR